MRWHCSVVLTGDVGSVLHHGIKSDGVYNRCGEHVMGWIR